ncbi:MULTISPECIES: AraC family transcriptional regulator [Sorangium]|uniref:AraC family transcriptional regulator n=1 Tax=Sorangium TaxID=39643 RepID=UPI0005D29307
MRILDIALESHFASETSFTRSFRHELGRSPVELRASSDAHAIVRPAVVRTFEWLRQVGATSPLLRASSAQNTGDRHGNSRDVGRAGSRKPSLAVCAPSGYDSEQHDSLDS